MIDIKFILLMFFMNVPNVFADIFSKELNADFALNITAACLYTICLASLIAIIILGIEKINFSAAKFLKYTVLAICGIIFLTNLFTLNIYGFPLNRTMLEIILATNSNEVSEFLLAYVLDFKFLSLTLIAIMIFVAICKVKLPNINKNISIAIIVIAFLASGYRLAENPKNVFEKASPISKVGLMLPEVIDNMKEYEDLATAVNHQVQLTKNESDFPMVIFVIGESESKNHMQIYGYDLPTTPNLIERNSKGELKIFTDTVSPHSHTMPVLQTLFTFLHKENYDRGLKFCLAKGNFFDILNAAGYRTAWISNQEFSGIYGNIGRMYSETCQRRSFTHLRDSKEENSAGFDEEILPLLDNELALKGDKNFFVIHLMGSHSMYNRRYPEEYGKFKEKDEKTKNENSESKKAKFIRARYDNSILYTDYVLNEIIKRVENMDAICIYLSDHGEDVYDDKDFAGHEETSPSRFMIEIPFIIWTSPTFRQSHPEFDAKISAAVDKPFMTDDMIHFLMDIMKIETEDFDPTLSPFNPKYNSQRKRTYSGKLYDKEHGLR